MEIIVQHSNDYPLSNNILKRLDAGKCLTLQHQPSKYSHQLEHINANEIQKIQRLIFRKQVSQMVNSSTTALNDPIKERPIQRHEKIVHTNHNESVTVQ